MPVIVVQPYKTREASNINWPSKNGWTVVYQTASDNYNTRLHSFSDQTLVANSTRSAIGYFNELTGEYSTIVSFPTPTGWKTQHPFRAQNITLTNITVRLDMQGPTEYGGQTLRYGYASKTGLYLSNGWSTSGDYGRIGFVDMTESPFYAGFAHADADSCVLGHEPITPGTSGPAKRFIIMVQ